jgi:hypothetical protein
MLDLVDELGKGEPLDAQFEIEDGRVTDFFLLRSAREWAPLDLAPEDREWLVRRLNSELIAFASDADGDWNGVGPVPDGAYIFPIDGCELYFELKGEDDGTLGPAIPLLLRIFGFSLSRLAYVQIFEPSYFDLQSDYVRSRKLANKARWSRTLIELAFFVRALRISAECLALDWLHLSWRRFVWLVFALVAGSNVAAWLFGL